MQQHQHIKLQGLLAGQHDWMLPLLAGHNDARPRLHCGQITCAATLTPVLEGFAARRHDAPWNAVVSLWSQYYFATLCLPLIATALACGESAVSVGASTVLLDAEGKPAAVDVAEPRGDQQRRETPLDPLMDDHLVPVSAALAKLGGLSEKVIWGNAAHYLEWLILWLDERNCLPASTMAGLHLFLQRDRLPDGRPNPLKGAIRYEGDARIPQLRRRKVCCLRYVIPGMVTCGGLCPRPEVRAQALVA